MENKGYALLDSGAAEKLEDFAGVIVKRPSTLAIWKKQKPELWVKVDASYDPKAAKWTFSKKIGSSFFWNCNFVGQNLQLRFQDNGQVGVFPEHASYLHRLHDGIDDLKGIKILNLFAFTGMASLYFSEKHAQVTHVDMSKKATTWAKENISSQAAGLPDIRWVLDDAVAYLRRELRRSSNYNGIIIDPPSFSRISKNDFWKIEEVLPELVSICAKLLEKDGKFLAFTCHDPGISAKMLTNLIHDNFKAGQVQAYELGIPEQDSKRVLPAGSCGIWKI